MYALYRRTCAGDEATHYQIVQKNISLFGCNNGYIPWLLRLKVKPTQAEPFLWHINVLEELDAQEDHRSGTLVID